MSFLLSWIGLQALLSWILILGSFHLALASPIPKLPPVRQKGLASTYTPWTEQYISLGRGKKVRVSRGKPYCWPVVKRGDPILAHRSLPCGARVYVSKVTTPNQGAWMVVGDRGPYGACVKRSRLPRRAIWMHSTYCREKGGRGTVWYVKRRVRDPGIWRAVADLSPEAKERIKHNGFEPVEIRYWKEKPIKRSQRPSWVSFPRCHSDLKSSGVKGKNPVKYPAGSTLLSWR
jgi:hypothetical protein